ncbi:response regulator [Petroclostridium sp. X23]|uniref:response regulator n=1 Tax=Petroclostridium sp. X23 TaxID=3045146 RepID=UPI0024AD1924|nr:response regulator [Petroclostridium sp. X23]WHH59340.1 response regulator [Petroclostridium sp. X23]
MIKVLIVEDDPMVAQLNKRYVQSVEGFDVLGITSNGDEALGFCKKTEVDLIILDIYMPKTDGISFLKELRKRFMMIDVILVTASRECQNIDAVLKLGAVDYLMKPFGYERLKKSLESYAGRYKLFHDRGMVEQEDLDIITKKYRENNDGGMIKGLHKKTLERIRGLMEGNPGTYFSSEDIARKTALSKVTVRKYLEYLESIGEVKLEVEYGDIGRPSHLYKYFETTC